MASEKKPSIYYDRSTIGSSAELDEYGVWVKSEPQDLSFAGAESQDFPEPSFQDDELPDTSEDLSALPDLDIPEEDGLGGLDDLGLPEPDTGNGFSDGGGDTEAAIETVLDDVVLDDAGLDDAVLDDTALDDAAVSEDDAAGFTEIPMEDFLDPAGEAATGGVKEKSPDGADLSTQLLMKIADELSSIRTELTALKKEFASVKGESPPEDHGDSQNHGGGFFDEEDDEKIALTGDELNNILNTADFTEETGSDATEELQDESFSDDLSSDSFAGLNDTPLPAVLSDEEDIIGAETETADAEKAEDISDTISVDNISVDTISDENISMDPGFAETDLDELGGEAKVADQVQESDESFPDFSMDGLDEIDELKQLREEGAKPMTPPPEDTTYLEEDPLAVEKSGANEDLSLEEVSLEETPPEETPLEEISLEETSGELSADGVFLDESLDLSEAVIDEPDLSAGITENPVEEPLLDDFSLEDDISIDLDLSEAETADVPEETSAEDISIDIPEESPPEEISPDTSGEISFDLPEETFEISEDLDNTPELPSVKSDDDSFAPVIPEGFIVEADDSSVPFEDDIEEKEALAESDISAVDKTGETPPADLSLDEIPETAEISGEAEDVFDDETLEIPSNIKQELKTVLSYMDQLLESLPDEKIEEFAKSEYFDTYKKLFKELGLV
jgi:hypothetical protein